MSHEPTPPAASGVTDSAAVPAPEAALYAPPAPAPRTPQYVTLGTSVVHCVVTAVFTLMAVFFAPPISARFGYGMPAGSGGKVVYLDFDKLLVVGMKRATDADHMAIGDVKQDANKFQSDVNGALQKYADAGYLIINNKALIKGSPELDITADMIGQLGMKP